MPSKNKKNPLFSLNDLESALMSKADGRGRERLTMKMEEKS